MPQYPSRPSEHYPNAPIREALIDIRCEFVDLPEPSLLEALHLEISDTYPKKRVRRIWQSQLNLESETGTAQTDTSAEVHGYIFQNEIDNQVVQYRRDGFTFSRLPKYQRWEDLRDEARQLWSVYLRATSPISVTRVAVRYINAIVIPALRFDLADYFQRPPELPDPLPKPISEFFSRYAVTFEQFDATAIVQFAFPHARTDRSTTILLDIDAYASVDYVEPFDVVWDRLEDLRIVKNEIFEAHLTNRTRSLFR